MFEFIGIVACLYITFKVFRGVKRVLLKLKCHICGTPYKEHPFFERIRQFWQDHQERVERMREASAARREEAIERQRAKAQRRQGLSADEIISLLEKCPAEARVVIGYVTSEKGVHQVYCDDGGDVCLRAALSKRMVVGQLLAAIRACCPQTPGALVHVRLCPNDRIVNINLQTLVTTKGQERVAVMSLYGA